MTDLYRHSKRERETHQEVPDTSSWPRVDTDPDHSPSWPIGDPCPVCNEPMQVGSVGHDKLHGQTITWEKCSECDLGWGPFTGYVDLQATDETSRSDPRPDQRVLTDVASRVWEQAEQERGDQQ